MWEYLVPITVKKGTHHCAEHSFFTALPFEMEIMFWNFVAQSQYNIQAILLSINTLILAQFGFHTKERYVVVTSKLLD